MTNCSEPHSAPAPSPTILTITTGHADNSYALFNPGLYQLTLIQGELEQRIDLGYSGSRLLERLLQVPGEVVSREELLSYAWTDRVVGSGSLNQQIYTLRQALGDDKNREIIQTLPRRGYQINPGYLSPAMAPVEQPTEAPHTDEPHERVPVAGRINKQLLMMVAGCAAVSLMSYSALHHLRSSGQTFTTEEQFSNVELQLVERSEPRLKQLREASVTLGQRLNALGKQGTQLTLSQSNGYYQLICQRKDHAVRTFMFHDSQLPKLKDEQLLRCLS